MKNSVKEHKQTVDMLEKQLGGKNSLKKKEQTIRNLKEQLRKLKEIDIVIEEQKREHLPEE